MTDSASKINLFMKISLNYTHSTMLTCVPSAKQTEIQNPMKIILYAQNWRLSTEIDGLERSEADA